MRAAVGPYQYSLRLFAGGLGLICAAGAAPSFGATIAAPVSAVATSQFDFPYNNDYSIFNTINQSGLSLGYESGVTDLASYLAKNPKHTSSAKGKEWFSQDYSKGHSSSSSRSGSAKDNSRKRKKSAPPSFSGLTVTYGFSALTSINGFVLWNEEFAGLGTTQLLGSADGITYTLLSTITPKASKYAPAGSVIPYGAQLFSFDVASILFFQLVILDCPGPPKRYSSFRGCGIGEVAFSVVPSGPSQVPPVPVPGALPLLGSALGFLAWFGRRRRKEPAGPR